jgi:transposase
VLQYHFHWNHLSAIAGLTWWNFYFRLYSGSINKERVVEFLQHLMRHIPGDILIVWDRLTAHRSRLVRDFIEAQEGRVEVEWLPAYAPELNPVEYLWGQLKHHELPNFCPRDLWHLGTEARRRLRRMQRRPSLIVAFWKQADLFDEMSL